MADDLSVAIERLRTSTKHLNTLCDRGAELVRDVESFFDESNIGMPATVRICDGAYLPDAEEPDFADWLIYRRLNMGKFRIAVQRVHNHDSDEDFVLPWSECGRDDKLRALEKLPDLVMQLAARVEEKAGNAEKALSSLSPLLQLPKKRKGG